MKPVGALTLFLLAAGGLAGCLGPAPPPVDPYQPRTQVAIVDAPGVAARDLSCTNETGPRACAEFWLVQITGSENATLVRGPAPTHSTCSTKWVYSIRKGNQSIEYNQSRYQFDPEHLNTIFAVDFQGVTLGRAKVTDGCSTVNALHAYPSSPYPNRSMVLGSYGVAKVTVYPNGFVVFGEGKYFVDLGKKVVVSYGRLRSAEANATYYVQGGFEIVNLGPWSKDKLFPRAAP